MYQMPTLSKGLHILVSKDNGVAFVDSFIKSTLKSELNIKK